MRIDAHQHFWIFDPARYGWIGPDMAVLRRDFLPEDLEAPLAAAAFDACLAVQARPDEEETAWLLALAARYPFIAGVVGWTDLRAPDADARLTALARNPRLVGLRHLVQDEPDDRFLLRDDFRRGLALLGRHHLVYDLLLHPRHLPSATEVVASLPGQRFVLDHLAKPFIREGQLEPWRTELRRLAALPNVAGKLSGLVTEAAWHRWAYDELAPYLDAAFEAFGEDRVLFGSDWPVCLLAASYDTVVLALRRFATRLSPAAEAKLFGGNAARIYVLPRTAD